jgi:putative phage-type endonuclease
MSALLNLAQGSAAWHAHRAQYRNASETAAVLGVSPWVTPYQLWCLRTGRTEQEVTPAMQRGSDLEPTARAAYEQLTGHAMEPVVMVDGDYSASLDRLTLAGDLALEIKCPVKGRESEVWQQAAAGILVEPHFWQVQHQLMVSGAGLAHF